MLMMEAAHSLGQHAPLGCTLNVLHDTLGRGLQLARVFWSHLRSFVIAMKPKHSLNHNIKSVPLVLTGNMDDAAKIVDKPPPDFPAYALMLKELIAQNIGTEAG